MRHAWRDYIKKEKGKLLSVGYYGKLCLLKMHSAAQTGETQLTDLVVWSLIASYITVRCVIGASALQFHRYKRLIQPAVQTRCSNIAAFQGNVVWHIFSHLMIYVGETRWSGGKHVNRWMD